MKKNGYLLFWSGIYSQWYKSKFVVDGDEYKTAEHWMMAEKARLFNDEETLWKILETSNPRDVKALGRKVKNFDKDVWDANAIDIVAAGNYHKFTQNEELLLQMYKDRDYILVEASPLDPVWGIGLAADDPRAWSEDTWLGSNWLGISIMKVRKELFPDSKMPS